MSGPVVILGDEPGIDSVPDLVRQSAAAWLATSPRASHALREARAPVLIPEDLVAPAEVEAVCVDAFEGLRTACACLDAALGDDADGAFYCALCELGKHVDGLVWRALVLARLRARMPGCALAAFPPAPEPGLAREFVVTRRARLWSAVLARMDWAAEVVWLPALMGPVLAPVGIGVRQSVRRHPWLWSAVQSWRLGLHRNLLGLVDPRRPALLMLKAPYDWMPVLRWAEREGLRLIFDEPDRYFPDSATAPALSVETTCKVDAAWDHFLQNLPLPAREPVRALLPEVRRLAAAAPATALRVRDLAARTRDKFRVAAVLNAIGPDARSQTVLHSYRCLGVPVLKWQHGAVWWHRRVTQRMDDCDLGTADTHLVYGPGAQEAYRAAGRHGHCRVLAAGSTRLAALHARARAVARPVPPHPRTLLYTTTNYYCDDWYCGFSPPFLDGVYYRDQVDLVRRLQALVASNPELQLTVKLPRSYSSDYPPPWAAELRATPRCRVISRERPYADLVLEHDAVLIDCATTTLLEALCTDCAVYVLLRAPGWPAEEVQHLRRRAVCADEPAALIEVLTRHVRTGEFPADRADETFLRRHGLVDGTVTIAEAAEPQTALGIAKQLLKRLCAHP